LAIRREAAEKYGRVSRALGTWRLIVVLAGAVLAWWNFWLLPIPVLAFVILIVRHEHIVRRQAFERRAAAYYEAALARLDNRWAGTGDSGERFRDTSHPYSEDLDIFGKGSLYQRINSARTAAGESTLAEWLLAPADPADVRARQGAVEELKDRLDLREDLALLGEDVRSGVHPESLTRWGTHAPEGVRTWHRVASLGIAVSLVVALTGLMLQLWTLWPLMLAILAALAFHGSVRPMVNRILDAIDAPARDLEILSELLRRLEREPLQSARMAELKRRLETEGLPPSRQIARLRRLIAARDQARNQMFAVVAEPLFWSSHFAFAIERWRQVSGPRIGDWIAAAGEMEALTSIAGYAAEHPNDPFPILEDSGPLFDGTGIAHPLIPEGTVVRNDVRLDTTQKLLLVSGSNMSGKSTLLRSVGLNTVLAWAGAPVRAEQLRVSCLSVGASMRIQDSVLDGKSRFYAEITRLRQIVDMAERQPPLLFLLDELLSGTNSHDRRIGSEAVVRSLVARDVIGLITTHDLALARIADGLAPVARNVHFEDHIEDGRIAFDYRMRAGVVTKSNAIELMRSVGLEV
jgi:hypothetical protein